MAPVTIKVCGWMTLLVVVHGHPVAPAGSGGVPAVAAQQLLPLLTEPENMTVPPPTTEELKSMADRLKRLVEDFHEVHVVSGDLPANSTNISFADEVLPNAEDPSSKRHLILLLRRLFKFYEADADALLEKEEYRQASVTALRVSTLRRLGELEDLTDESYVELKRYLGEVIPDLSFSMAPLREEDDETTFF